MQKKLRKQASSARNLGPALRWWLLYGALTDPWRDGVTSCTANLEVGICGALCAVDF